MIPRARTQAAEALKRPLRQRRLAAQRIDLKWFVRFSSRDVSTIAGRANKRTDARNIILFLTESAERGNSN